MEKVADQIKFRCAKQIQQVKKVAEETNASGFEIEKLQNRYNT